jgi:hypothetical protein
VANCSRALAVVLADCSGSLLVGLGASSLILLCLAFALLQICIHRCLGRRGGSGRRGRGNYRRWCGLAHRDFGPLQHVFVGNVAWWRDVADVDLTAAVAPFPLRFSGR